MLMGQHGITTLHAGWVGTATETHSLRAREAMSAQPPQQGKMGPELNRTEGSQRGGTPPKGRGHARLGHAQGPKAERHPPCCTPPQIRWWAFRMGRGVPSGQTIHGQWV